MSDKPMPRIKLLRLNKVTLGTQSFDKLVVQSKRKRIQTKPHTLCVPLTSFNVGQLDSTHPYMYCVCTCVKFVEGRKSQGHTIPVSVLRCWKED